MPSPSSEGFNYINHGILSVKKKKTTTKKPGLTFFVFILGLNSILKEKSFCKSVWENTSEALLFNLWLRAQCAFWPLLVGPHLIRMLVCFKEISALPIVNVLLYSYKLFACIITIVRQKKCTRSVYVCAAVISVQTGVLTVASPLAVESQACCAYTVVETALFIVTLQLQQRCASVSQTFKILTVVHRLPFDTILLYTHFFLSLKICKTL